MQTVTIPQIIERLQKLSGEQLASVYDFVSYLADKEAQQGRGSDSETRQAMLASESILRRDWDRPEEDAAWADL